MSGEMGEGLRLAAVGMGLVFLTLLVFMLILFALRKLFPGEEMDEDVETVEAPPKVGVAEVGVIIEAQQAVAIPQEPSAAVVTASTGSIAGGKIAAMAVAMYLSMEQEESAMNTPVSSTTMSTSQSRSKWTTQGRDSLRQSQGHRPQAYGQKIHSAYSQKTGVRE